MIVTHVLEAQAFLYFPLIAHQFVLILSAADVCLGSHCYNLVLSAMTISSGKLRHKVKQFKTDILYSVYAACDKDSKILMQTME